MKYTSTYINRNLIQSAVIKVFSDVLLNIRPGLFSLDNYIAQKLSVSIGYVSIIIIIYLFFCYISTSCNFE